MTGPQRRALEVLWEYGPLEREEFAKAMWPESPSWKHPQYSEFDGWRNYSLEGAAGTFLGRLKKLGLVTDAGQVGWWREIQPLWGLTELGQRVLRRERILEKIA